MSVKSSKADNSTVWLRKDVKAVLKNYKKRRNFKSVSDAVHDALKKAILYEVIAEAYRNHELRRPMTGAERVYLQAKKAKEAEKNVN